MLISHNDRSGVHKALWDLWGALCCFSATNVRHLMIYLEEIGRQACIMMLSSA